MTHRPFLSASLAIVACCVLTWTSVVKAAVLWDNGPYLTNGFGLSIGWNQSASTPFRYALTDDFVLASRSTITRLNCYGYMTGNVNNQPQIIAGYVRILADDNGEPGDVILGDWTTPREVLQEFTGDFYLGASDRGIYRVSISLPQWELCPGTYWVQYNLDNNDVRPSNGSLTGNYFSTLTPSPPPEANGYHYDVLTSTYFILDDPQTGQGNAPPFSLEGEGCALPGDFDGDALCTMDDVPSFVEALLSGAFESCADVNEDCEMNGLDVQAFVQCILP
ncbi:MAG: hypothetical protein H6818_22210 [Phycisphaerales bacterium]|nr:hypothetical protein [Phycisphaerales bacterium]MCB9862507.1 hypothetical protein [Phycisphaerales bacterium]